MYNNRFFATKSEAHEFKKKHGGVLYSVTKGSRTKSAFLAEMAVALDGRGEIVDPAKTPFCVAWTER